MHCIGVLYTLTLIVLTCTGVLYTLTLIVLTCTGVLYMLTCIGVLLTLIVLTCISVLYTLTLIVFPGTLALSEPVGVSRDSQTAELPEESSLNDYDVNNEVAIALALVNQRSLSSLTEKQREKVRQLRAGVQGTTNRYTVTEHNDTTVSSMPTKQAANNPPIAQKPPPAIVPQTKVAVTKKPVEIAAQISECSTKTCKKREPVIDNETAKIDKNEIVVDNSSNVTKQEAPLSTDCDLIRNTQHKKSVKSKVHEQGTKEQAGKKLHQRKPPTQNIGTQRVKTLLQNQTIVEPKQQTKSQLKPVQHKKRIPPPGGDKHDDLTREPKPNSTTTDQEKSRICSDTPSYSDDQVTSSVQSKVQSPLLGNPQVPMSPLLGNPQVPMSPLGNPQVPMSPLGNPQVPMSPLGNPQVPMSPLGNPQVPMAAALLRHSKQEADSQSIEQDTTNETNSKSDLTHPIEWEEPATPEEIPPNFFNHPDQQLTPLLAPQDITEDNKQLSNDEKAHALIHFAQELIINDFLTWKRGPLGTIEHPTAHTAVPYWDSSGQPTQWTEDFADDVRNEPAHIKTNPTALFSPIHTPSDIGTPHLSPVQTVPMETLQLSPVPHSPETIDEPALRGTKAWQSVTTHEPALRGTKAWQSVTTHEPALRGTKAWQLPNNVLPPRMIDTSVQTDSIEPEDDYSTSAAVLLPPVSVRGLQRPHNPGGHFRPGKKSKNDQSEAIREAGKDKPDHDREDKMKAHIVKSDKWSLLENNDKKPIKVIFNN